MEVSHPISTPKPDHDQSPPLDQLDSPKSPPTEPLQPSLTVEFDAILNFKENAAPRDDAGQQKQEVVVENETLKDGDEETAREEIVKDGWSDDGYGRVDDGGVEHGNSSSYMLDDGWNDVEQPDWKEEGGDMQQLQYPLRPGAEDCNFYLRMGSCKFGSSCKFNHPPRTRNQAVKPRMKEREDSSERPMQIECKYYLSGGGCKYGKSCRFNHSKERLAVVPVLEYNFLGLPIRPGEKECPYYMRNGSCKYGANCRFNHPDPTAGSDSPSGYANSEQAPSWSPSRPLNEVTPFLPVSYSSAREIHSQISKWNQVPVFTQENSFGPPTFGSNIHPATQSAFSHFQPQLANEEFPERPGQPECTYYIKTGDCKFRYGCKFHHPKDRIVQPSFAMTEKGLPLRPGQSICTHYRNYGICKFGPKCRYDHPPNIEHMAPSVITGLDRTQHPLSNFASPDDTSRLSSLGEGTITL